MSTHRIILLTSDVVVACPHNETPINILLSFSNESTFENEKNVLKKKKKAHCVLEIDYQVVINDKEINSGKKDLKCKPKDHLVNIYLWNVSNIPQVLIVLKIIIFMTQ